jgi:hypothetical protein
MWAFFGVGMDKMIPGSTTVLHSQYGPSAVSSLMFAFWDKRDLTGSFILNF